jgi:hypothetical protein
MSRAACSGASPGLGCCRGTSRRTERAGPPRDGPVLPRYRSRQQYGRVLSPDAAGRVRPARRTRPRAGSRVPGA